MTHINATEKKFVWQPLPEKVDPNVFISQHYIVFSSCGEYIKAMNKNLEPKNAF